MNGKDLAGRQIRVSFAEKPRPELPLRVRTAAP